jgi:hypothetical protein
LKNQDRADPRVGPFSFLARHRGFLLVLALAAPLTFAFAWQGVIATLGDDSVSYLVLAHYFRGGADNPYVAQWAAYQAHFPPLFPLLLAASGGVVDLRIAYALVAALAVLALPLIYRYAALQLGRDAAGLAIVVLFLLTPTAWISLKGILSESLYLVLAMASVLFYETRLADGRARPLDALAFGVLLGCVYLTRVAGLALMLAYALHVALRLAARRQRPSWSLALAWLPVVVLLGLWYGLRPRPDVDAYRRTVQSMIEAWIADPGTMFRASVEYFASGWIATLAAQQNVALAPKIVFGLLGIAGLAGAVLRAARNRLDGWFVLFSVAMVAPWVFSPNNTRRLLYPLVALLLICAADFVRFACERWKIEGRRRTQLFVALAAFPVALFLPALALIAQKSLDRAPVLEGQPYAFRDITDYYTTINLEMARALAESQVTTLAGLESIRTVTAPGSKVMWMRPEYVALLGRRAGVPFYYAWSPREVAGAVRSSGADYIVVSRIFKTDVAGVDGDPLVTLKGVADYSRPAFHFGNDLFVLMKVDREALDAFLARPGQ